VELAPVEAEVITNSEPLCVTVTVFPAVVNVESALICVVK